MVDTLTGYHARTRTHAHRTGGGTDLKRLASSVLFGVLPLLVFVRLITRTCLVLLLATVVSYDGVGVPETAKKSSTSPSNPKDSFARLFAMVKA